MLSASPGTVELWTLHAPSARFSSWPPAVRDSCRSRPGSTFCTRGVRRDSPFIRRVRNSALYHSTVSPDRRAAGWLSGSRLNWVFDFSKLPPHTQRATQLRSRQRNRTNRTPHSTTSTASSGQMAGRCTSSTSTRRAQSTASAAVSISRVHLGFCFMKYYASCGQHQTSIRMGRIMGLRLVRR